MIQGVNEKQMLINISVSDTECERVVC